MTLIEKRKKIQFLCINPCFQQTQNCIFPEKTNISKISRRQLQRTFFNHTMCLDVNTHEIRTFLNVVKIYNNFRWHPDNLQTPSNNWQCTAQRFWTCPAYNHGRGVELGGGEIRRQEGVGDQGCARPGWWGSTKRHCIQKVEIRRVQVSEWINRIWSNII